MARLSPAPRALGCSLVPSPYFHSDFSSGGKWYEATSVGPGPETENDDRSVGSRSSGPESQHGRLHSEVYAGLDSKNAKEAFV